MSLLMYVINFPINKYMKLFLCRAYKKVFFLSICSHLQHFKKTISLAYKVFNKIKYKFHTIYIYNTRQLLQSINNSLAYKTHIPQNKGKNMYIE